jgi:hypothetical protein
MRDSPEAQVDHEYDDGLPVHGSCDDGAHPVDDGRVLDVLAVGCEEYECSLYAYHEQSHIRGYPNEECVVPDVYSTAAPVPC